MAYMGGYDDHDCWWRCIAYFQSCGENYDADAAMGIARGYFGDNFDENSYAFTGTRHDAQNFVNAYFSGMEGNYCNGQILIFNPSTISGWSGDGSYHAVVVTGNDGSGHLFIFDPRSGMSGIIDQEEVGSSGYLITVGNN